MIILHMPGLLQLISLRLTSHPETMVGEWELYQVNCDSSIVHRAGLKCTNAHVPFISKYWIAEEVCINGMGWYLSLL